MDITTLFQAPIVETVGGESVAHTEMVGDVEKVKSVERVGGVQIPFHRVPSRTVGAIIAKPKGERRDKARKDAADAKLDAAQTYRVLQEASGKDLTTADITNYIDSPEGADAVLRDSLTRAKLSAEEIEAVLDAMPFTQQSDLALRLTGVYSHTTKKLSIAKDKTKGLGEGGAPPLEPKGFTAPTPTGSESSLTSDTTTKESIPESSPST